MLKRAQVIFIINDKQDESKIKTYKTASCGQALTRGQLQLVAGRRKAPIIATRVSEFNVRGTEWSNFVKIAMLPLNIGSSVIIHNVPGAASWCEIWENCN